MTRRPQPWRPTCGAAWPSGKLRGRIERFALGAHDVPDRLSVPEKLYGREREVGRLLEAFGRVVRSGTTELVLVSGCSGVGKSSVVNELNKALVPSCGLFASGKFDQFKRRRLGNRPIERLADLPPMTDPACRATLDVLTAVLSSAWFTDTNLHDLLVARMANLSLEHGNSDGSCNAYAVLGTVLGSHFGDYQAGLRFCKLGQTLLMAP
ncbi:MAG TPA: AAA family ATPase [Chthoniobacterales bacterium]